MQKNKLTLSKYIQILCILIGAIFIFNEILPEHGKFFIFPLIPAVICLCIYIYDLWMKK